MIVCAPELSIPHLFTPDRTHAEELGARMRKKLAGGLRHIAKKSNAVIPLDVQAIERACVSIETAKAITPNAFGIYNDLLLAISENRIERVEKLFAELTETALVQESTIFSDYMNENSGKLREAERYARYFNADATSPMDLGSPDADCSKKVRETANEGMGLLRETCPQLAQEIDALVSEVVFCSNNSTTEEVGGAASFPVWGAVLVNADVIENRIDYIQGISHESGHVKLFAYATEEPLVHNPPADVFSSPLRHDPRPMDGIFHATYVLARMHWTANNLSACGKLTESEKDRLNVEMRDCRIRFEDGIETIGKHARLSETGSKVIADAAEYINDL